MTKNGTTYYYHVNGHGDVVALTDGSGNTVAQYSYDAWGNIISQSGSMDSENPLRYAGYRYDEATGLYYLMARYYDPEIGRFITRDTFLGFPEEPLSLNLYKYAHSNPLKFVDSDGHSVDYITSINKKVGKDITKEFMGLLRQNAQIAKQHFLNLKWFKNMVGNKKPWDLKQKIKGSFIFMGKWVSGADLGNIHYGYVGTATGFSSVTLLAGAGYAQIKTGTSRYSWFYSFFDDPQDQKMIRWGISLIYKIN